MLLIKYFCHLCIHRQDCRQAGLKPYCHDVIGMQPALVKEIDKIQRLVAISWNLLDLDYKTVMKTFTVQFVLG
jgi:hypothetical protein